MLIDLLAVAPAIVAAGISHPWLLKYGDKSMDQPLRFFVLLFAIGLGLIGWSCAVNYFEARGVYHFFNDCVYVYALGSSGVFTSFTVRYWRIARRR